MFNPINKTIIKYIICTIVIVGVINLLSNNKLKSTHYLFILLPIIGLYVLYDTFSQT